MPNDRGERVSDAGFSSQGITVVERSSEPPIAPSGIEQQREQRVYRSSLYSRAGNPNRMLIRAHASLEAAAPVRLIVPDPITFTSDIGFVRGPNLRPPADTPCNDVYPSPQEMHEDQQEDEADYDYDPFLSD